VFGPFGGRVAVALTPGAWLDRLEARLDARWTLPKVGMGVYDAYYEGDHNLAFATSRYLEAYGNVFAAPVDNWCALVVDSRVERLEVQGFRFGRDSADDTAWGLWQASGLDAQSDMLHEEAVKLGESYWLVEPPAAGTDDPPRITAEHPSQVIVATAPGDHRDRLAALKKWVDEDGYAYATVYLPDSVHKYRSVERPKFGIRIQWRRREDDPGGGNPIGEVPIVPVMNRPRLKGGGRSDLQGLLHLQDAINKLLSDMLITSEYQAFPQRVLMGVQIPRDPTTGQPLRASEVQASQSRLWVFENAQASVHEFSAAELKNYVEARDSLVRHFTAQSRTPPHYSTGTMVNVSADALKAAETGLVSVVRREHRSFGEAHEDTLRLAFKSMGDERRAGELNAETIWKDPESRSQAELADALTKLKTIGVPDETLWSRYGFSPVEIERMLIQRERQPDPVVAGLHPGVTPAENSGNSANGATAPMNGAA
jgi:hypothetical protein